MSFRRNSTTAYEWKQWRLANRDKLIACGIPEEVLESKQNWFYFLGHGYFTPLGSAEPSVNVETLDQPNAERLCDFLEEDLFYPNSDALNRLQHLLKRKHS